MSVSRSPSLSSRITHKHTLFERIVKHHPSLTLDSTRRRCYMFVCYQYNDMDMVCRASSISSCCHIISVGTIPMATWVLRGAPSQTRGVQVCAVFGEEVGGCMW